MRSGPVGGFQSGDGWVTQLPLERGEHIERAGLRFVGIRDAQYELCIRSEFSADPRWLALTRFLHSAPCRQMLSALPGCKLDGKRRGA